MEEVIRALQEERDKTVKKLDKLDRIIADLNEMDTKTFKKSERKNKVIAPYRDREALKSHPAKPKVKLPTKEKLEAVNKLIEDNWKLKTDGELREMIGEKFNHYYSISNIKQLRKKLGLVNPRGNPGKKRLVDCLGPPSDEIDEDSEPEDDEEIDEEPEEIEDD